MSSRTAKGKREKGKGEGQRVSPHTTRREKGLPVDLSVLRCFSLGFVSATPLSREEESGLYMGKTHTHTKKERKKKKVGRKKKEDWKERKGRRPGPLGAVPRARGVSSTDPHRLRAQQSRGSSPCPCPQGPPRQAAAPPPPESASPRRTSSARAPAPPLIRRRSAGPPSQTA